MLIVSEVDGEFKEHLKDLVPQLLSKDTLIVKEISGNRVTGQDLIAYFKVHNILDILSGIFNN